MFLRLVSIVSVLAGLFLLTNALVPILGYEFFFAPKYQKDSFLSPVPQGKILAKSTAVSPDLTRASNWFIGAPQLPEVDSKLEFYNLSIPKLGIEDASAKIGGEDLSKSLIHYRGTALPGKRGNAVVFGHSTLPQLFNPKNYLSIFSKLPTLKIGDRVYVNYDGVKYTYKVEEIFEVEPTDFSALNQNYDDSYLTLITCVPPGTYLRRLVVKARLEEPD